ncbi:MAG: hypothetical protein OXK76_07380 [Gammaproteobacteria bacterium]|nr:hypothetical protein [Gammaproteobacteria bacterium]
MRRIALILPCLAIAGCTSLQPIQMQDDELHSAIRSGPLVVPGNRIEVIDSDGDEHVMEVYTVDDQALRGRAIGRDVEVAIDDIVSMRIRGFSALRTVLLVPVGAVGFALFVMLHAPF